METTTKKPDLFWSERGQIGCALPGHVPYRGSDTWIWERWKRITPREAAAFEREVIRSTSSRCNARSRR